MKRGLIGPFQLGVLSGASEALKIAEQISGQPGFDLENVFYASAFQAGVDQFLFPESSSIELPSSEFIRVRTEVIRKPSSEQHWKLVDDSLSRVMPEGWHRNERYSNVWELHSFLSDLLDAMAAKASYLAVSGIPSPAELETELPPEMLVPISTFLKSFEVMQPALPAVHRSISRDDFLRLYAILESDLFKAYSLNQSSLDSAPVQLDKALAEITTSGRKLVTENPKLLSIARGGLSVLSMSAKLIDAVFGKIPGAAAEAFVKLGQSLLDQQTRIVIYDFESSIQSMLITNLVRMIRDSEKSRDAPDQKNAS